MNIVSIDSTQYEVEDNVLFVPYDNRLIEYFITVETEETLDIDFFKVSFINSTKGFKYKLNPTSFVKENDNKYLFYFNTNYQSSERANIDFIDLTIFGPKVISLKSKVKVVQLKSINRSFNYQLSGISIVDSNLLSLRNRIMSPSWGTINKNLVSNGTKMLDVLHTTFNNSYFKVNEYLRQTYQDYNPLSYSRLRITNRPSNIIRYVGTEKIELKETDNIFSSLKEVKILDDINTLNLLTVVLESYSRNNKEIEEINKVLPLSLYLKNNSSNESNYTTCVIVGYDEYDNRIIESILTRRDLYTKTKNKFYRIESINTSNSNIEVTNYVDLSTNHFIINNNFIIPPIVDQNYRTFKPLIKKLSNNDLTHNIITISNPINTSTQPEIKFSIDTDGKPLDSVYVTEDLDIIYTYRHNGNTILNYSKVGIDFSKNIYNNVTQNNNRFISVSDTNTNIGDWVDVNINFSDWVSYTSDEAFFIQIRNKDKLYYYDIENKALSLNKVINYNQTITTSSVMFSIEVENDDPYLITLFTSDLKIKANATTITNQIHPYLVETIVNEKNTLIYDEQIYLYDLDSILNETLELETEDDFLYIILKWKGYNTLDYLIDFEDYFISNNETTINPSNYSYITKDNNYMLPIVLKIDTSFLTSDILKIGTGFNINNSLIDSEVSCELEIINKDLKKTITLSPKLIQDVVNKFEYQINYKTLVEEVISDY